MDVETAARESYSTGLPCTFTCTEYRTHRTIVVTVYPDGRITVGPVVP